eukprot:TRINITY_DN1365_c0_g1_i1.p1 TRINITY_DN1365_c0_g1~~TRINITY_DN1365_c0_g1_i1.p1  ORF type:complete len:140 (-),score=15.61 TRINITY_DN1365_c0_g1_i1:91-510(-)
MEQELPPRTVPFRFPKVPDFTDPDYERRNPEHHFRAIEQRIHTKYLAIAEMRQLQEDLRLCYIRSGVNARRECYPLTQTYLRRLKCSNYICDDDEKYLPPVHRKDLYLGDPDDYLETEWHRNRNFYVGYEPKNDYKREM